VVHSTAKFHNPPSPSSPQAWPGPRGQDGASKPDPTVETSLPAFRAAFLTGRQRHWITAATRAMAAQAAIAFAARGAPDVAISFFPTEEPDAAEVRGA